MHTPVKVPENSISARVKAFRDKAHMTQKDLGDRIGVSQAAIDKIEKGGNASERTLIALGNLVGEPDCWVFWKAGGVDLEVIMDRMMSKQRGRIDRTIEGRRSISESKEMHMDSQVVTVPLLKDAAAAGTPRLVDERLIESYLPVPKAFCPHPDHTTCIHVTGDSMSPILEEGYIVAVDAFSTDLPHLYNQMVVAIDPDGGVTIKWLRRSGKVDLLVPQHTSQRHSPIVITGEPGWRVIGKVAWWIGMPPARRKSA